MYHLDHEHVVHHISSYDRIYDDGTLFAGRLDQLIYIPMPDATGKVAILNAMLRKTKVDPALDLEKLATSAVCEGFSGADLKGLVQIATGISTRIRIQRSEQIRTEMMDKFYARKGTAASTSAAAASKVASKQGNFFFFFYQKTQISHEI